MNVVCLGTSLGFEGMTPKEIAEQKPGLYVVDPEATPLNSLAKAVEFHRQAKHDYDRLRAPHTQPMPPEQVAMHAREFDKSLGDLAILYGELVDGSELPALAA